MRKWFPRPLGGNESGLGTLPVEKGARDLIEILQSTGHKPSLCFSSNLLPSVSDRCRDTETDQRSCYLLRALLQTNQTFASESVLLGNFPLVGLLLICWTHLSVERRSLCGFSRNTVSIVLDDRQWVLSVCWVEVVGLEGERWLDWRLQVSLGHSAVTQKENVKYHAPRRASLSGRTGRTGCDEILSHTMSHTGSCYLFFLLAPQSISYLFRLSLIWTL